MPYSRKTALHKRKDAVSPRTHDRRSSAADRLSFLPADRSHKLAKTSSRKQPLARAIPDPTADRKTRGHVSDSPTRAAGGKRIPARRGQDGDADRQPSADPDRSLPDWLVASQVYRRLPAGLRGRLDRALILRPRGFSTLEAIAEHFRLESAYGIPLSALGDYADRLEAWIRPVATSLLMGAVLGCLPAGYRARLVAGGEVMLLSRVMQSLTAEGGNALSVAELARLAGAIKGLRPTPGSRVGQNVFPGRPGSGRGRGTGRQVEPRLSPTGVSPDDALARAVRTVYGLPWPVTTSAGGPADAPPADGLRNSLKNQVPLETAPGDPQGTDVPP